MQHFTNVLKGIDELNKEILDYQGTNIFLYAKLKDNLVTDYVQY